jgi:uncharacterized membrane protein (UPF0127 family)
VRLDEIPPPEGLPPRVKELLHRLDTDDGVRHLWWVIIAVAVLGLVVFIGRGGSRPADPSLENGAPRLAGFGEVRLVVGERDLCAALAETEQAWNKGLMGRTDLAGYDAMVFSFPAPTATTFYMRNTPLPLSVAWFDDGGSFVGSADMAPCDDRSDCPTYAPPGKYVTAVEVPRGQLGPLGMSAGSHIDVGGVCQ